MDLFEEMFKHAVKQDLLPFVPHLTPVEMMVQGVFGKSYFANATDEDFEGMLPEVEYMARQQVQKFKKANNRFDAKSGDSKEAWAAQGWLKPEDPLGWFQWYCRYHSGRRHMRDTWQIVRWQNFGQRWGLFGRNQIKVRGWCSNVVKQGLLQWGYEPNRVLLPPK